MCLYPRLIRNPKYKVNKKNQGNVPAINDQRTTVVAIGCGKCIECRKQKAREWQVRLLEDIKTNKNAKFITLTFTNESIKELNEAIEEEEHRQSKIAIEEGRHLDIANIHTYGYARDNKIAKLANRRFLERWRKEHKKSLRHWLVTELGGNGTENIHMHGLVWTDHIKEIPNKWKYGFAWIGNGDKKDNYVNEKTVNYITKYVNKTDPKHKEYRPIILTSSGIGRNYIGTLNASKNKYQDENTNETYRTRTGHKIAMPIYWRNKIYTEAERERLWLQKLDKNERWIMGERIDISQSEEDYNKLLQWHQRLNTELGYGGLGDTWSQERYENERRDLLRTERIKQAKKTDNETY